MLNPRVTVYKIKCYVYNPHIQKQQGRPHYGQSPPRLSSRNIQMASLPHAFSLRLLVWLQLNRFCLALCIYMQVQRRNIFIYCKKLWSVHHILLIFIYTSWPTELSKPKGTQCRDVHYGLVPGLAADALAPSHVLYALSGSKGWIVIQAGNWLLLAYPSSLAWHVNSSNHGINSTVSSSRSSISSHTTNNHNSISVLPLFPCWWKCPWLLPSFVSLFDVSVLVFLFRFLVWCKFTCFLPLFPCLMEDSLSLCLTSLFDGSFLTYVFPSLLCFLVWCSVH